MLIDPFQRQISYIRISVTDRCDLRCRYCMNENMQFLPREQILTLEEIERLAWVFVKAGIRKIRITGGEPLVRKGIIELLSGLNKLKPLGLQELVMTTNGTNLQQYAKDIRKAGVNRLNISLDTLNSNSFTQISRNGHLDKVLDGIEEARKQGFESIKLNSVLLRGFNDHEALDLLNFAIKRSLDISFIEEMPLGEIESHERKLTCVSNDEIKSRIQAHFLLEELELAENSSEGPAKKYSVIGTGTTLGLISPHSHNFCASCNRVRLTAEGRLLLCLGNEHSVDFRALLRNRALSDGELVQSFIDALTIKPEKHEFNLDQAVQIVRFMNMTGG